MSKTNWLDKLTDRSFLGAVSTTVSTAVAAYAIWQTQGVPVGDKINATMAAFIAVAGIVSMFTHAEKSKDASIATAAITAANQPPASVNVGSAETVNAPAERDPGARTRADDLAASERTVGGGD